MRWWSVALGALGGACASLTWSGEAAAAPTVALVYEAPAECPNAAEIARRLATRDVRVDASAALRARVTIARRGSSLEGTATIDLSGERTTRTFVEPSCASLADALVVVVAIAVLDAPEPPPPVATSRAPGGPPDVAVVPPPKPLSEAPDERARGSFAVGAAFAVASHVAPRLAPGGAVFAELVPLRHGVLELSLRLGVEALSIGAIDVPAGSTTPRAAFTWIAGRLDLGGLRFRVGGMTVHLGATVGAGALRAEGLDVSAPRTVWAPLVDVGPFARARIPLGPVALELGAAFVVPAIRARFFFAPNDATIFAVPPVGAFLQLGVSLGRDIL